MVRKNKQQRRRRARVPRSLTGSVTSRHEVAITLTDFFDYTTGSAGNVTNYWWENNQNLFNNNPLGTTGQELTFSRVRSVKCWALPRRGLDVTTGASDFNNAAAMYTVNVQTPGFTNSTLAVTALPSALATNVQVTNVLPQFDTKWKQIFSCDLQKTFQSATIRPWMVNSKQCLFSISLLDPTSGNPIDGEGSESVKIRIKVQLEIDQPIAPVQTALLYLLQNNDTGAPQVATAGTDLPSAFRNEYVQMDVKKVRNCMS